MNRPSASALAGYRRHSVDRIEVGDLVPGFELTVQELFDALRMH